MVASSSKKAWWLDAEVSNPLLVVVHDAEAILLEDPLILLFVFLQRVLKDEKYNERFHDVFSVRVCVNACIPVSPALTSVS